MPLLEFLMLLAGQQPDWSQLPTKTPRTLPSVVSPAAGPVNAASPASVMAAQRNVAAVQQAVEGLLRGDAGLLNALLHDNASWNTGATRPRMTAGLLDSRAAKNYAGQMAGAIRSGRQRLQILSVTAQGNDVIVMSRWNDASTPCRNIVRFDGGRVVQIVEHAD
jgi:hypothetical protein